MLDISIMPLPVHYSCGAPDTAWIPCLSFTLKRHRQLRVKHLLPVHMYRLQRDSNPLSYSRPVSTLPIDSLLLNELCPYACFQSWSITLSFASLMGLFSSWLCALVHRNKGSLCIFRGLQGFCLASSSCTLKFSKN